MSILFYKTDIGFFGLLQYVLLKTLTVCHHAWSFTHSSTEREASRHHSSTYVTLNENRSPL